jgi:hypothetical protein
MSLVTPPNSNGWTIPLMQPNVDEILLVVNEIQPWVDLMQPNVNEILPVVNEIQPWVD